MENYGTTKNSRPDGRLFPMFKPKHYLTQLNNYFL